MLRRLFLVVSIVSVVLITAACSSSAGSTGAKPSQEIIRKSVIGTDWQMYQIRLILPAGSTFPVLFKLAPGDKADGYYYLEKGSNVDFSVVADSTLYHSTANATGQVSSDRFSFTASRENGSTYSLQFTSAANVTGQQVVFLEVMYPVSGSIYVPLETK